jgi:DNA (cytosine-5)-methyltransferase 1
VSLGLDNVSVVEAGVHPTINYRTGRAVLTARTTKEEVLVTSYQEARTAPRSGDHAAEQLRIGSLFAGIGGLELGLEWAGVGRTVYQVERDEYCQEVLAARWPGVPRWGDITELNFDELPACDILVGGFPCQGVSVANTTSRTGLHDPRSGLWSYMARAIEVGEPQWVVVENVAHGWRKWLPSVRRDLGRLGYKTLPVQLEARQCGLRHVRRRCFVLAHADGFKLRLNEQRSAPGRAQAVRHQGQAEPLDHGQPRGWPAEPGLLAGPNGLPRGLAGPTFRAIGNAVVPQCAQVIGYMIRELIEAGAAARRDV